MRVLWYSRGSEVFIAAKAPQQRAARRNNQVLSKEEELEFLPEVAEAKKKEIENYCDHRAIEAVLAKGDEWNVMTAKWVLTWKWSEKGWKIKARLASVDSRIGRGPTFTDTPPPRLKWHSVSC